MPHARRTATDARHQAGVTGTTTRGSAASDSLACAPDGRFINTTYPLGDRIADNKPLSLSPALQVTLAVAVVGVIIVGIFPQPFIKLAQDLMLK